MLPMRPPMQRPAATPTGVAPTLARPGQMPAGGQSLPLLSNPISNLGGGRPLVSQPTQGNFGGGMAGTSVGPMIVDDSGMRGGSTFQTSQPMQGGSNQPAAGTSVGPNIISDFNMPHPGGMGGGQFGGGPQVSQPPTMYKKGGSVSAKEKKSSEHGKKYTHSDGKLNLGHGRVSTATKNLKHSNW